LVIGLSLLLSVAFVAMGEPSDVRARIDELAARQLPPKQWPIVADQFVAISREADISDADKAHALICCMRMLNETKGLNPADKGVEVFSLYREFCWGHDAEDDREAALLDMDMQIRRLKRFNDKLPEALEAIDGLAELGGEDGADFGVQRRELLRASAHSAAADHETAFALFQEYFERYEDPRPDAYGPYSATLTALNRHTQSLEAGTMAVERYGASADGEEASEAVNRFRTLVFDRKNYYTCDKFIAIVPRVAQCRVGSHALVMGIADKKQRFNEADAAVEYARLEYDLASLDKVSAPLEMIAKRFLNRKEYEKANGLMDFQKYGAPGPDGVLGNQDDLSNPMAEIPSPLSPGQVEEIETKLAVLPEKGTVFGTLKARGAVCLLLGRYDEAVAAFRSAYRAANVEEAKNGCGELAIAIKALDGYPIRADRWLAYQATGPAGKDGILDTKDDVADPLAGQEYISLPLAMERALRAMAYGPGDDLDSIEAREIAFLALGECRDGLEQACKGVEAAKDRESLERAVKNVAAAIKAFDGHVKRANDYLAFQYYGPEGPDGELDTPDDMVDPLPEVLQEAREDVAGK
jgi:tetratricopeptide (TPR) repeat protein